MLKLIIIKKKLIINKLMKILFFKIIKSLFLIILIREK